MGRGNRDGINVLVDEVADMITNLIVVEFAVGLAHRGDGGADHEAELGIAGRLDDRLTVGSAYRFERVACHGVGVGSGPGFRSAEQLGWQQWPGDAAGEPIGDLLACGPQRGPTAAQAGLLLTACAAAANPDDVRLRKQLYPDAMAEDMEGFAVALACRLRGVPLDIVRGISNSAGDRDKAAWQTPIALEAAAQLSLRLLTEAL